MPLLHFSNLKSYTAGLAVVSVLALSAPGAQVAMAAELSQQDKELAINGPYYKKLVQMKDVVADILPPPAYIIEAQLGVLQLIDLAEVATADGTIDANEAKTIEQLIAYGVQLKDGAPGVFPGYYERIEVWKKELSEATPDEKLIKRLLTVKSVDPATKFFTARDASFVPLIRSGDVKGAKTVARNELKPLYLEHRAAVDAVVTRARRMTEKIEKEVADKLASADAAVADLRIKSPLYLKVIQMKDLVADILPPPAYIIESYLTVLQQIDETEVALADGTISAEEKELLAALVEYGRQLESGDSSKGEMAGYKERIAVWVADLGTETPEDIRIKDLMTKLTCAPALKFYEVRNASFLPTIAKGEVAAAKTIVRQELLPQYEAHRKQIDLLVTAANSMYERVQAKVDALLSGVK